MTQTSFFDQARVLITGGSGFLGSNLMLRLLKANAKLRVTRHRKPIQVHDDRIECLDADLRNPDDCDRAVQGMDYVFMCAANTAGANVMAHTPLVHVTPNVVMNTQMLEAAYKAKIKKFVFISSCTGYPPSERAVKEDEMFQGEPYISYDAVGSMKRYMEMLCRTYAQRIKKPMTTIVVRPTSVFGPYDDFEFETSHVLPALIRRTIERHNPFVVWGDGRDIKDFLYVDDAIEAMLLACEKIDTYDPINVASGEGYVLKDVIQTILELDGYSHADIRFDAKKPTMIPKRLIDTQKAKEKLGFEARTPLREGLRKTIHWYRQRREKELLKAHPNYLKD